MESFTSGRDAETYLATLFGEDWRRFSEHDGSGFSDECEKCGQDVFHEIWTFEAVGVAAIVADYCCACAYRADVSSGPTLGEAADNGQWRFINANNLRPMGEMED